MHGSLESLCFFEGIGEESEPDGSIPESQTDVAEEK